LTILETLRHEVPHPNIAAFLGCSVTDVGDAGCDEEDHRVVSIVMQKYQWTLAERCKEKQPPLDVTKCIKEISAALTYLHSKNLCHNDVHMGNVVLKDDDTAVLIDFDAFLTEGDPLKKGSALEWRVNSKTSNKKNDWFGVSLLKEELLRTFPPPDARPPEGRPSCSGGSSASRGWPATLSDGGRRAPARYRGAAHVLCVCVPEELERPLAREVESGFAGAKFAMTQEVLFRSYYLCDPHCHCHESNRPDTNVHNKSS